MPPLVKETLKTCLLFTVNFLFCDLCDWNNKEYNSLLKINFIKHWCIKKKAPERISYKVTDN